MFHPPSSGLVQGVAPFSTAAESLPTDGQRSQASARSDSSSARSSVCTLHSVRPGYWKLLNRLRTLHHAVSVNRLGCKDRDQIAVSFRPTSLEPKIWNRVQAFSHRSTATLSTTLRAAAHGTSQRAVCAGADARANASRSASRGPAKDEHPAAAADSHGSGKATDEVFSA